MPSIPPEGLKDRDEDLKRVDQPRVLRRLLGYLSFARKRVGASAASLFLVDASGMTLRGIASDWDWTRTSFASNLADWPNVAEALRVGQPVTISAADAVRSEAVWFENRAIGAAHCVPLRVGEEPVGVMFFDFDRADLPSPTDAAFLVDVAMRCARALARPPPSAKKPPSPTG